MTDPGGSRLGRLSWTLVAALGTAGVAAAVATISYAIMRLVVITSVSHAEPPDALIGAVPLSILSAVVFVVIQRAGASRAGGFDVLGGLWIGLFGALGAVFVVARHSMPAPAQLAFLIVGVVFLVMALATLVVTIVSSMPGGPDIPTTALWGRRPSGGIVYTVANLAAAAGGIAAGLAIVQALEG